MELKNVVNEKIKKKGMDKYYGDFYNRRRSKFVEFLFILKVMINFIRGFRVLHYSGKVITIFGSARVKEKDPTYQSAYKVAFELSKKGYTILTGGGPGIMEAANRGAKDSGGLSIGCNIDLPMEQKPNPYLDKWVNIRYFFIRKTLLIKYSVGFIVFPGGFGTLDELFESMVLMQTKKIKPFPIIVFDTAFHKDIIEHITKMHQMSMISDGDTDFFTATDDIEKVVNIF